MRPTLYDSGILQDYADDLYRRAANIVISTTLEYGGTAFLLSLVGSFLEDLYHVNDLIMPTLIIITALGGAIGIARGRIKAFYLKLEAQKLLCQRQIELNTHK